MPKLKLALLVSVIAGFFVLPAAASACTLPALPGGVDNTVDEADAITKTGNFGPELKGKFIQVPFDIPNDSTGLRIRYCFDEAAPNPTNIDNSTIDLGVYEPNAASPGNFTMAQRRGWSGSSIRIAGIGVNGFTDEATYELNRKVYVPGKTSRAFSPGPIPAGEWAIELGGGYIDPALTSGVDWKVELVPTDDLAWSNTPFVPDPYEPNVANPAAGWYTGDLHVHGENEPGNALISDTANLAFNNPPAGIGLDFITLVDHNNDVSKSQLGAAQDDHPGNVIVSGTEMTTYDGHFNSQNSDQFVDFRVGEIQKFVDDNSNDTLDPGELELVRAAGNPSSRFAEINTANGWGQINHPTIFQTAPAQCRGCAWNYSAAQTDFSKVDAIELQTGVAGVPAYAAVGMNPFTLSAIEYYETALASGAHIAAIGSSDDHQAKSKADLLPVVGDAFDSTLGEGSTVVYADQLSQAAITKAVKDGHTYVKPFGPTAPDVRMVAGEPGKADLTAIPGDSVTLGGNPSPTNPTGEPIMNIQVEVTGANSGVRPGNYTLDILQDGISVDSVPVTGATFNHNYQATETGRYSFKLTRLQGANTMIEAYSTPIWFTAKPPVLTCETDPTLCPVAAPSNKFSFKGAVINRKKGTAQLKVKVVNPGTLKLAGKNLAKSSVKARKKNQVVKLNIKPKGKLKKTLKKKGKASVTVKVTHKPNGGKALTKKTKVKLKQKKAKGKK